MITPRPTCAVSPTGHEGQPASDCVRAAFSMPNQAKSAGNAGLFAINKVVSQTFE
jgi:hypothetical protein